MFEFYSSFVPRIKDTFWIVSEVTSSEYSIPPRKLWHFSFFPMKDLICWNNWCTWEEVIALLWFHLIDLLQWLLDR